MDIKFKCSTKEKKNASKKQVAVCNHNIIMML